MMLKPQPDPAVKPSSSLVAYGTTGSRALEPGYGYDYGFEAGQGVKQRMKMARATTAQIQRARPRRSQGS